MLTRLIKLFASGILSHAGLFHPSSVVLDSSCRSRARSSSVNQLQALSHSAKVPSFSSLSIGFPCRPGLVRNVPPRGPAILSRLHPSAPHHLITAACPSAPSGVSPIHSRLFSGPSSHTLRTVTPGACGISICTVPTSFPLQQLRIVTRTHVAVRLRTSVTAPTICGSYGSPSSSVVTSSAPFEFAIATTPILIPISSGFVGLSRKT
ncbi:hypothetical protein OH76DRAFT_1487327 [Lentinus brumalis]|uniref:Uncharacterized protein n=1 Tax=Lentinus brumalis TaxID=2498619 RepID=A0A371CUZ7_9APHY|nr:hypothetical protein OH76DRAFT_1487327 [Polyporus brumalis]